MTGLASVPSKGTVVIAKMPSDSESRGLGVGCYPNDALFAFFDVLMEIQVTGA